MKKEKKVLSVPREMKEIEQEFQQQSFKAGSLQYQIRIMSRELDSLNERLEAINKEAAARNQLNAQNKTDGATAAVQNG